MGFVQGEIDAHLSSMVEEMVDPEDVVQFDMETQQVYRQKVVRQLVKLKRYGQALPMLNHSCDAKTYEMVLRGLQKHEYVAKEFRHAFEQMKSLGYKRSSILFERMVDYYPEKSFELFLDMKDECEISEAVYLKLYAGSEKVEECLLIVKEAKRKGINVDNGFAAWVSPENMQGTLKLNFELEAEDTRTAYDSMFDALVNHCYDHKEKLPGYSNVFAEWKLLGYDRSRAMLEAEIYYNCSTPKEKFAVFSEMKACGFVAKERCYQHVLDHSESFETAREVVREAKRSLRGRARLKFNFKDVLQALLASASDVPGAVTLLKEVGSEQIDAAIVEPLKSLRLDVATPLFEGVVKNNLGVKFPKAMKAYFKGRSDEVIEKYASALPCVLQSFAMIKHE